MEKQKAIPTFVAIIFFMQPTVHPLYTKYKLNIIHFIENFDTIGVIFGDGKRNQIKLVDLEDQKINIKSFKIPHIFNQIVYKFFRKSKAKRSYQYANKLLKLGIGTPQPIAFFEKFSGFGLKKSYYISEHLQVDLMFKDLVDNPAYQNHELILRQFTKFCFDLHQNGIEFLDHSPGNTLIKKISDNEYQFFLVDLNRMHFHDTISFEERMKNLSRLTPRQEMIVIMSDEYAKFYNEPATQVFEKMWHYTCEFQETYRQKQRLKKRLKF